MMSEYSVLSERSASELHRRSIKSSFNLTSELGTSTLTCGESVSLFTRLRYRSVSHASVVSIDLTAIFTR